MRNFNILKTFITFSSKQLPEHKKSFNLNKNIKIKLNEDSENENLHAITNNVQNKWNKEYTYPKDESISKFKLRGKFIINKRQSKNNVEKIARSTSNLNLILETTFLLYVPEKILINHVFMVITHKF
jgi:hypothetical protein